MRLLFELLGEHETLPRAEVLACIEAEGHDYEISEEESRILVLETEAEPERLGERLGLTRYVDEHLASGSISELEDAARGLRPLSGSIALRRRDLRPRPERDSGDEGLNRIGGILANTNPVDLDSPDNEVRLISGKNNYLALKKAAIERSSFGERKVDRRPFFSPISLHPKYARALVNLARTSKGKTFLDPFCGTGGILIEAGLIGAELMGSDIKEEMIEGCRENLLSYNLDSFLFRSDVGDISENVDSVSSIVTDPPYGRSSTTMKEELGSLYRRSFESFSDVLERGGYLAIVLPDKAFIEVGEEYLRLEEVYEQRVHRSLTRFYCVFKNY
ncbi:MAG: methyltransferase domain-containing protein [Methanomassiliicoccales archaeon]|nr:MAG: methyltransferase domain-containing protein [Methanomassiliicoccales archaeon]